MMKTHYGTALSIFTTWHAWNIGMQFFYIWSNWEKLCQNILLVADKYVLTKLRMRRQFGDCNARQGNAGFFDVTLTLTLKQKRNVSLEQLL
jgi:hypothetical protein